MEAVNLKVAILTLARLEEERPATIADLAGACRVSRATMVRILRTLREREMIVRRREEFGGPTTIDLTEKGEEAARHASALTALLAPDGKERTAQTPARISRRTDGPAP